jgi:hypothetical protein
MLFRLEDVCGFEGGHDGAQSGQSCKRPQ